MTVDSWILRELTDYGWQVGVLYAIVDGLGMMDFEFSDILGIVGSG
jgi:hypothetical protein